MNGFHVLIAACLKFSDASTPHEPRTIATVAKKKMAEEEGGQPRQKRSDERGQPTGRVEEQ